MSCVGKIEGMIEVRGRQGRRCEQLVDDLKEKRGYRKLKEEEEWLWTCHNAGCVMNECTIYGVNLSSHPVVPGCILL
jgi:hypothetical protein